MEDIAIDIPDDLETAIREVCIYVDIPDDLETAVGEVCIYEVPTQIRIVREAAYTPQVVSIGLIHKDKRDKRMESQKKRYLKEFCQRLRPEVAHDDFRRELVGIISEQKQNIINCYEKDPNISQDDFVKMILLDAVFIMELFLRRLSCGDYGNDLIIGRFWFFVAVQQDLLLLENQLPFKILDQLYNHSLYKFKDDYELSFLKLTCEFFSTCGPSGIAIPDLSGVDVLHFTDVVRHFWLIVNPGNRNRLCDQKFYIPSATNLHDQAGVEFELFNSTGPSVVTFEEKKYLLGKVGKLVMSNIIIEYITEAVIRNVMILEHCCYPKDTHVCNYITLLDCLINTVEDVNLLVEAKIIINHLGDNALVSKMINELCYQYDNGVNSYYHVFQQLDQFSKSRCNRRMATLKRVYFKDTWTSTATIVGALVIVLQLAQTFSSIWQIACGSK